MGCTRHATLSVSGENLIRTERSLVGETLATETLVVERLQTLLN